MPIEVPLNEAESCLSALVQNVHETGAEYAVTVRAVPLAMIVPVPSPMPARPRAMGRLAGKRPIATRDQERAAYQRDLEARHVVSPA